MAQNAYPTFQDVAPSWADISATFSVYGGQILETVDFSALNWNSSVEIGELGGPGPIVKSRTTGRLKNNAGATLYAAGFEKLIDALAEKAPTRGNQSLISLVAFDVLGQWTPPGAVDIRQIKLAGCRLLGLDEKATEGVDAAAVEIVLNPMQVIYIRDGREIVLL